MVKSIIDGVDKIIDEGHCLIKETPANFDANKLVSRIYEQLEANLKNPDNRFDPKSPKGPPEENWRLKQHTKVCTDKSKEKNLERTIVSLPSSKNWFNQVQTSSKLRKLHSDKNRNIDLVHKLGEGAYEFIELKVRSNTPMYAAFEIVINGLIYLVSREFYTDQYIDSKEILKARKVHLQTLAPQKYYSGCSLSWLENELNKGLKTLASEKFNNDFEIDFTFTSFPESFDWSCKDNELVGSFDRSCEDNNELVQALNNGVSEDNNELVALNDRIVKALNEKSPVEWHN